MRFLRPAVSIAILGLFALSPLRAQRVELLIDEGDKVKNAPQTLSFEYKFRPGEMRRYDVTVQGDGNVKLPGQKDTARLLSYTSLCFIQSVKSFNSTDGVWKMDWDMIKGVMTIPEFGDTWLTIPPTDFEMDKYGAVRSIKGIEDLTVSPGLPQGKVFGDILRQMKAIGFPKKALSVGDKWEDKYVVNVAGQEPVTIVSKSEFVGYERVRKMDCAKIHTTYDIPFSLKLPEEEALALEPAKSEGAGDTSPADAEEAKPIILKGQEKAEFWTHFAYAEGKLLQSFGSIELSADILLPEGVKAKQPKVEEKPVEVKKPTTAGETPPAPDLLVEKPKHDLFVEFKMISKFNPDIPKSLEEIEVE